MTFREGLACNNITRRPCGCRSPFREWPHNLLTLLGAWGRGRSYANWDGFWTGEL